MRVYPRGTQGRIKFYLEESNGAELDDDIEKNCSISYYESKFYLIFECPYTNETIILPLEFELEQPNQRYILLHYGFIKHNEDYFNATGSLEYSDGDISVIWNYIASFSQLPQKLSYKTAPEI